MPSFIAKYRSADGGTILGGVTQSQSSRWSHREDAESYLAAAIENNASAGRRVVGEVVESDGKPEIARCCPNKPAQAVGYPCFGCRRPVQNH